MSTSSSSPAGTRVAAFFRSRLIKRSLIGLAGFLVVFGLFGYFALPGIIKSQAEKLVEEKLHRKLSIDAIHINPYALKVEIQGLKLLEPDGKTMFVAFDALEVNVSGNSLWHLAPVVKEVGLRKPYVHLVRTGANHYNIDDIIELINSQPPSDEPARFAVYNIHLEDGRIEFDDQPEKALHTIADLKLGLPFISSLPSNVDVFVEPMLSAKVNDTPLDLKGRAKPFAEPKQAMLDLELADMDLTRYMDYVPFEPRFKLPSARLNVHVEASFQQPKDAPPSLKLNGDVALRRLAITDLAAKPMLGFDALQVTLKDLDVFSGHYDVQKIALEHPQVHLVKESDGSFNLARLAPPPAKPGAKPGAKAPAGNADKSIATPTDKSAAAPASKPAAPAKPVGLKVNLGEFLLTDGELHFDDPQAVRPMKAGVDTFDLAVRKVAVDTAAHRVDVAEISSGGAAIAALQGKASARPVVAESKPASPPARTPAKGPAPAAEPGYTVNVERIAIKGWTARVEDQGLARPVVTTVDPVALTFTGFSTAPGSAGTLDFKAGVNKTGQLSVKGGLGIAPLHADLALDIQALDLLPTQPYFTDQINLLITRAALSTKGAVKLDQDDKGALKGGFKGDLTVGNLATIDKISSNDFLKWKSLYFGGIDAKIEPLAVSIDQIALSDFFARIIIDPSGHINLQDIARNHPDEEKSLTEVAPAATKPEGAKVESKIAATSPPAAAAAVPAPAKPMPPINIRKITLQGGQVKFSDNFIKPNYSADLMQLGGFVTGLSSKADTVATTELRGQVNGAPLNIAGRLNPLKGDLFLDIKADVKGMELAQFTPYSAKYVGYGIDKGKLSFEVAYNVDKRQLTAQNRLVLDQLTFGEKIDSPTATKLPVQLAVALLRDRNGVIDINLPIGGSLDDPQFSVGGIIVKVIINVITKAITAPFALLGSLFGGGEELSWLDFDAGRYAVPAGADGKLTTLAKALNDRPALKLEIAGRVDAETDKEGLRRASIERKVKALKLKDGVAKGESSDLDAVTVTPEEYPALLKRVYKDEKFPKPRNLVGLQKDLPVEEMEKLMLANAEAGESELAALANQRAQTIKDWLVKNGQVPPERIFIVTTKSDKTPEKATGSRADFSLK